MFQDAPGYQAGIARFLVEFRKEYPTAPVLIHYQKTMESPSGIQWYEQGKWLDFYKLSGDPVADVPFLIERTAQLFELQVPSRNRR